MTTMLGITLLLQGDFDDIGAAAGGAAILGMGLVMMLVMMAVLAVFLIGFWKVYAKAGKPGWASLVPIYNVIVLLEIVGRPLWWVVLCCIPFVNFVVVLVLFVDLAKSFGEGIGVAILCLVGGIGILMLGFGGARYVGPAAAGGQIVARSAAV